MSGTLTLFRIRGIPVRVDASWLVIYDLARLVDDFFWAHHVTSFPVVAGDRGRGIVSVHALPQVPREQWATTPVESIMLPLSEQLVASPRDSLWRALEKVSSNGLGRLAVVEDGGLAGYVSVKDVMRVLTVATAGGRPASSVANGPRRQGRVKIRLLAAWYLIRGSYWFLPALLAAAAVGLSALTIAIDDSLRDRALGGLAWVYAGGPDGARALLSTVAGSMTTVAALVFSITMVVLSQASAQLGPRLLTLFMRDTGNQLVLGTFVATFIYCMLVLRTVRADPPFVPHVSVTVAITLAVAGLGVLIWFFHHTAVGIQADTVIAAVAQDLDQAIDHLYPEKLGEEPGRGDGLRAEIPAAFEHEARTVAARGSGYIRAIDTDGLMALATERDLLVQLLYRPGHFVVLGGTVARVWPLDRVDEAVSERVGGVFLLGKQRTLEQDVEFAVNQLVEIALRALSPGINDPFTAITCVDRLGAALRRLAERALPSRYRYDGGGALRVVADVVDFDGAVDSAFDQIRQAARTNVAVTVRLLETIAVVREGARRHEDLETLQRHASMIWRGAETAVTEPGDRAAIDARYQRLTKPLE